MKFNAAGTRLLCVQCDAWLGTPFPSAPGTPDPELTDRDWVRLREGGDAAVIRWRRLAEQHPEVFDVAALQIGFDRDARGVYRMSAHATKRLRKGQRPWHRSKRPTSIKEERDRREMVVRAMEPDARIACPLCEFVQALFPLDNG